MHCVRPLVATPHARVACSETRRQLAARQRQQKPRQRHTRGLVECPRRRPRGGEVRGVGRGRTCWCAAAVRGPLQRETGACRRDALEFRRPDSFGRGGHGRIVCSSRGKGPNSIVSDPWGGGQGALPACTVLPSRPAARTGAPCKRPGAHLLASELQLEATALMWASPGCVSTAR